MVSSSKLIAEGIGSGSSGSTGGMFEVYESWRVSVAANATNYIATGSRVSGSSGSQLMTASGNNLVFPSTGIYHLFYHGRTSIGHYYNTGFIVSQNQNGNTSVSSGFMKITSLSQTISPYCVSGNTTSGNHYFQVDIIKVRDL